MKPLKTPGARLMEVNIDPEQIHEKLITKAVSRAAALVQEADENSYGTIVLGRRGLSNVKDFFYGPREQQNHSTGERFDSVGCQLEA